MFVNHVLCEAEYDMPAMEIRPSLSRNSGIYFLRCHLSSLRNREAMVNIIPR
jgi:hypothetical protein